MKYNAKFTKIEDGYYRAKINNVELWEVDELLVWTIKEREKEIERLNNIINEFDKWLDVNLTNLEKEEADNIYNEGLKQGMLSNGRLIKNKLQELKGSDKE